MKDSCCRGFSKD